MYNITHQIPACLLSVGMEFSVIIKGVAKHFESQNKSRLISYFLLSCDAPLNTIKKVIPEVYTKSVMIGEDWKNSIFMDTNKQVVV